MVEMDWTCAEIGWMGKATWRKGQDRSSCPAGPINACHLQIAKYICLNLQNLFVLNCKIYLSQIARCICLKLQNAFVSNCKRYLTQSAKCICPKLPNLFVSKCKMYLSQIARRTRPKLQDLFVSNCKSICLKT